MERLLKAIKDFGITILNLLLMIVTFGTKKIQKNFSIQTYEMKILKMKDDIDSYQTNILNMIKSKKKLEKRKLDLETQYKEIPSKIQRARDRNDIKTANKLGIKYNSLPAQIETVSATIVDIENNIAVIEKSMEMYEIQIAREEIKIEELKNKELTSKEIANFNNMVKDTKLKLNSGLNMKNIAETIENDYIDSKVENEVLLDKFSMLDNNNDFSEFTSVEEIDEFLSSINTKKEEE